MNTEGRSLLSCRRPYEAQTEPCRVRNDQGVINKCPDVFLLRFPLFAAQSFLPFDSPKERNLQK